VEGHEKPTEEIKIPPSLPRASADGSVADVPSLPSQSVPDALLVDYRGHRKRTWGTNEARHMLSLIADGYPIHHAARESGIPEDSWYLDSPNARMLRHAISEVYAHEGTDWAEWQLRRIIVGDVGVDPRATSAIGLRLKLGGRLKERSADVQGGQALDIRVSIRPGARDQAPAVEVQAQVHQVP
jgi:hypothetical protein